MNTLSHSVSRSIPELPCPTLEEKQLGDITLFTDERLFETGHVRIAFTARHGGVSKIPYDTLNIGGHVGDDFSDVVTNRGIIADKLGFAETHILVVPKQVHGDEVLVFNQPRQNVSSISDDSDYRKAIQPIIKQAKQGADAIVVVHAPIVPLLCFADCVPVIAVAPTGDFAVIHAGWRGVENTISVKTLRHLVHEVILRMKADGTERIPTERDLISSCNIYIGPYIHEECFETSIETAAHFVEKFGQTCFFDNTHINLGNALRSQLLDLGISPERICDLDRCTVCQQDTFFSFRGAGGTTGRHGALAFCL